MTRAIATAAQGAAGPSFRIRLLVPADELRRHGVGLVPLPLLSAQQAAALRSRSARRRAGAVIAGRRQWRRALEQIDGASVAVIQRQVDLLPGRRLECLVTRGRALVLDVDDAVWLPEPGSHPLARLRRNAEKLKWLAGRADRVIAGNEYLAEWLAGHARDVTVVPSLIDTDRAPRTIHQEGPAIVLGWIGSHSTARYLDRLGPTLAAFAAARRDLKMSLIVVGGAAPRVPGMLVSQWDWTEQREAEALGQIDIGLMPLPDNAWTRGKCAYKALQYMSAGVPVVADDVGVTGTVIGDGSAGVLARRPHDWETALGRLADSPDLRRRLGETGRAVVEQRFSVRRWGPVLAKLISGDA